MNMMHFRYEHDSFPGGAGWSTPDFGDVDEVGFDSFVDFELDPTGNDGPDGRPARESGADRGEEPDGLDTSAPLAEYPLDGLLIRSETRTVHGVFRRIEQGFYVMDPDSFNATSFGRMTSRAD